VKKVDILRKGVTIVDYFSIDDLNQFKKIEGSIIMQSLVESDSHDKVPK
jgi:hypothetical protein